MFIVLICLIVCSFFYIKKQTINDFLWHKNNWRWNDNWNGNGPVENNNKNVVEKKIIKPKKNIVADDYVHALDLSGESGSPVLIIYTADWCKYCQKMKNETLPSIEVNEVLKNYILVYINTNIDRSGVNKFNIDSLPSCVITNYKEEKIKFAKGFMEKKSFAKWLNEPNLFKQPTKN